MSINTDGDFERAVRDRLQAAASLKVPSAHLEARTRQRERHHARRTTATRVGTFALVGIAAVGGVVAIQRIQTEPAATPTSTNVDSDAWFPILDLSAVPHPIRDKVGATYYGGVSDVWSGVLGAASTPDSASNLFVLTVFPVGTEVAFDDQVPGRRAGVSEVTDLQGGHTLLWMVGDVPFSAFGGDLNTLYDLIDIVAPTNSSGTRGGYEFTASLPGDLKELVVPTHQVPHNGPSLSTDDGALDVAIYQIPPLTLLVTGGNTSVELTKRNDMDVAIGRHDSWTSIAIAVSPRYTMLISSNTLNLQQILQVADHITMVDESTWQEHFGLQNSDAQSATPTTTMPD